MVLQLDDPGLAPPPPPPPPAPLPVAPAPQGAPDVAVCNGLSGNDQKACEVLTRFDAAILEIHGLEAGQRTSLHGLLRQSPVWGCRRSVTAYESYLGWLTRHNSPNFEDAGRIQGPTAQCMARGYHEKWNNLQSGDPAEADPQEKAMEAFNTALRLVGLSRNEINAFADLNGYEKRYDLASSLYVFNNNASARGQKSDELALARLRQREGSFSREYAVVNNAGELAPYLARLDDNNPYVLTLFARPDMPQYAEVVGVFRDLAKKYQGRYPMVVAHYDFDNVNYGTEGPRPVAVFVNKDNRHVRGRFYTGDPANFDPEEVLVTGYNHGKNRDIDLLVANRAVAYYEAKALALKADSDTKKYAQALSDLAAEHQRVYHLLSLGAHALPTRYKSPSDILLKAAQAYEMAGKYHEAFVLYCLYREIESENSDLLPRPQFLEELQAKARIQRLSEKGQALFAEGRYQDAGRFSRQAYDLSHGHQYLFNAAMCLYAANEIGSAKKLFEEYLSKHAGEPYATEAQGYLADLNQREPLDAEAQAFMNDAKFDQAEAVWARAAAIVDHPDYVLYQALCRANQGRYAEALGMLDVYLQRDDVPAKADGRRQAQELRASINEQVIKDNRSSTSVADTDLCVSISRQLVPDSEWPEGKFRDKCEDVISVLRERYDALKTEISAGTSGADYQQLIAVLFVYRNAITTLQIQSGKLSDADNELVLFLVQYPQYKRGNLELGIIRELQGRPDEAEKYFTLFLSEQGIAPADALAGRLNRAHVYGKLADRNVGEEKEGSYRGQAIADYAVALELANADEAAVRRIQSLIITVRMSARDRAAYAEKVHEALDGTVKAVLRKYPKRGQVGLSMRVDLQGNLTALSVTENSTGDSSNTLSQKLVDAVVEWSGANKLPQNPADGEVTLNLVWKQN